MAAKVTTQAGPWNLGTTWVGGVAPVDNVDSATINHAVTITADAGIGTDNAGTEELTIDAPLTIDPNVDFTIRGDVQSNDFVYAAEGSRILFNTTGDARWEQEPSGINAGLVMTGTEANPCTIEAVGAGTARFETNDNPGRGRLEIDHATLKRLGSDAEPTAIGYQQRDTDADYPFALRNVTLDTCYGVVNAETSNDHATGHTGAIILDRVTVVNPQIPGTIPSGGNWGNISIQGFKGMAVEVTNCDFAVGTRFFFAKPDDVVVKGNVFRDVTFVRRTDGNTPTSYTDGVLKEFSENFAAFSSNTGLALMYGEDNLDNVYVHIDAAYNNPHFGSCQGGTGTTNVKGNVYASLNTASSSEGDGIFPQAANSGVQADNQLIISNCLCLPTANGFGNDATSATVFSMIHVAANIQVTATHNTSYIRSLGSANLGETGATTAGELKAFRGNLCVGRLAESCYKLTDQGASVVDTFAPADVSNNAGYNLVAGSLSPGEGYDAFTFTGGGPHNVGVDDVDGSDPNYVDTTRQPWTWVDPTDTAADGVTAACDRLSLGASGYTIHDLISYIHNGWRPRQELYRGAGHSDQGSRDIGCVPMTALNGAALETFDVPVTAFPNQVIPASIDEFIGRVDGEVTITPNVFLNVFNWTGSTGSLSLRLYFDDELSAAEQDTIISLAGDAPP